MNQLAQEQSDFLIDAIKKHLDSKTDYIEMLAEDASHDEPWFEVEIRYVLKKMGARYVIEASFPTTGKLPCDFLFSYFEKRNWLELKVICGKSRIADLETLKLTLRPLKPNLKRIARDFDRLVEFSDGALKWFLLILYPTPNDDLVWKSVQQVEENAKELIICKSLRQSLPYSLALYRVEQVKPAEKSPA